MTKSEEWKKRKEERLDKQGIKRCKSCGVHMEAVYCYSIREECASCGGESLVETKRKKRNEKISKVA